MRPSSEPLGAADARQGAAGPDVAQPAQDPELQEFDEISVYSRTSFRPARQVFIYGSVQRPGVYPFPNVFIRRVPGWELQRNVAVTGEVRFPGRYALMRRDERLLDVLTGYYIDRAGGFARRADRKRTYVVQPNGTIQRRSRRPEPGARILVPEVPAGEEKTDWGAVLSSVASVLTSALTIILVVQRL